MFHLTQRFEVLARISQVWIYFFLVTLWHIRSEVRKPTCPISPSSSLTLNLCEASDWPPWRPAPFTRSGTEGVDPKQYLGSSSQGRTFGKALPLAETHWSNIKNEGFVNFRDLHTVPVKGHTDDTLFRGPFLLCHSCSAAQQVCPLVSLSPARPRS